MFEVNVQIGELPSGAESKTSRTAISSTRGIGLRDPAKCVKRDIYKIHHRDLSLTGEGAATVCFAWK